MFFLGSRVEPKKCILYTISYLYDDDPHQKVYFEEITSFGFQPFIGISISSPLVRNNMHMINDMM